MVKGICTFFLLFVSFLFLVSCHKNDNRNVVSSPSPSPVTKVEGPDSIPVNQEASFMISYYLINSCGRFERVEGITLGDTTTVNVVAKYEGSVCSDVLLNGEATYLFKSSKPGTYYLKFWKSINSYLVDSIVVR